MRSTRAIEFGEETIDLAGVEQLVARTQVRGIARALLLAREHFMDGRRSLVEVLDAVIERVRKEGLDALDARRPGDLAQFRRLEWRLRAHPSGPLPRHRDRTSVQLPAGTGSSYLHARVVRRGSDRR